jgi:trimeric autotransporter adhesin
VRTTGRCLALMLALSLAGPLPVRAQDPPALDDATPVVEPPPADAPGEAARDPADQSPKDMIGSRWPAKPEDAPPPFAAVKTDRLGEAMREAQAAQEAAAKAAAEQAAADARAEARASERTSKRIVRHGKGKRLAARGRASARARAAGQKAASAGHKVAAKATAKSAGRQKAAAKTAKGGAKKQAGKTARRHRA